MTQDKKAPSEMAKAYEPARVEDKWYQFWLDNGYFTPRIEPNTKPFVIIMPPTNVTGELHVGHALTATLEDIMIRWHRMRGEPTLWLPGTDHAGIAAQVVVERMLAEEGLDRHQMGREKFLERMWQWARQCQRTINGQHQRLGISCDWSREVFTLDAGPSRAVRTVFTRLYEKGLIYRGERIINWCPRCATALSDLEVDHLDTTGHLYYIKYPMADGDGFVTVATTRPETMLGDTALAVNPDDERFKNIIGREVILPLLNRHIPIVGDEAVDAVFGTGAVKITPAHDPVDFEVARRHGLPLINVMNPDSTMNENAGPYAGMDRFACRKAILADLEKAGLLIRVEPYSHAVGHCHRCHIVIEPTASRQWFVRTGPLAGPAIEAVTSGRIRILPERFIKVYLNWMENIRDWCISRQLWWGHRIPVWYCADCDALTVSIEDPAVCSECGSQNIKQDPDVLDTWFSSALWPHSTLGWPDDTEDLRYFYPTTVMETGYDILFFWVARMIMMGLEDMGNIPFSTVYLHGLIRDEQGEKMSKVKGNVINPLETIDQYGTDALRFALSTGTSPGNDIKLTTARLEAGRNFANKLWNATRFILHNLNPGEDHEIPSADKLATEDRWILSRLSRTTAGAASLMESFQFGEAQRQIHDFIWGDFCDWYIEIAKVRLRDESESVSPAPVLLHVLETSLRLLHPFMPFITEELWQNLKGYRPPGQPETTTIATAAYPQADETARDEAAERVVAALIDIVRAIRNARAEHKVEISKWISAQIYTDELLEAITPYTGVIQTLARAKPVTIHHRTRERPPAGQALVMVLAESEIAIPMASMVDIDAERKRLGRELEQVTADIERRRQRLEDKAFLSKAPNHVVEKERENLAGREAMLRRLQNQFDELS